MKQVTITIGKVKMLVVDLSQEALNIKCIPYHPYGIYYTVKSSGSSKGKRGCIIKTDFEVKKMGNAHQLTEEDWKGIVDSWTNGYYQDYENDVNHPPIDGEDYIDLFCIGTATESGLSLLKANGVVMENSLGEEPLRYTPDIGSDFVPYHDKWKEAQEQVWLNPQVFIKL